jgi:hypothetical protein
MANVNANGTAKTNLGGISQDISFSIDADAESILQPFSPVGHATVDWTYSSGTSGTATMSDGHGIESAELVDAYWTVSGVNYYHYGATATVSGDVVALSGGSGTNYPASHTSMTLCKQVDVTVAVTAANITAIEATAMENSLLIIKDTSDNLHPYLLTAANKIPDGGLFWNNKIGCLNPITVDIKSATISTSDIVGVNTDIDEVTVGCLVNLAILYDCTT